MDLKVTIEIWQKDRWYVARCPELDFVSQGLTQTEARHNLMELIQIQFEEMTAHNYYYNDSMVTFFIPEDENDLARAIINSL